MGSLQEKKGENQKQNRNMDKIINLFIIQMLNTETNNLSLSTQCLLYLNSRPASSPICQTQFITCSQFERYIQISSYHMHTNKINFSLSQPLLKTPPPHPLITLVPNMFFKNQNPPYPPLSPHNHPKSKIQHFDHLNLQCDQVLQSTPSTTNEDDDLFCNEELEMGEMGKLKEQKLLKKQSTRESSRGGGEDREKGEEDSRQLMSDMFGRMKQILQYYENRELEHVERESEMAAEIKKLNKQICRLQQEIRLKNH